MLTPKGVSHKTKLALKFMQRKMKEYDELKNEVKNQKKQYLVFYKAKKNITEETGCRTTS